MRSTDLAYGPRESWLQVMGREPDPPPPEWFASRFLLSAYAAATRSPELIPRMVRPGPKPTVPRGTDRALSARYAVSGTELRVWCYQGRGPRMGKR
eukprot:1643957-Rhodomonas_salina.3